MRWFLNSLPKTGRSGGKITIATMLMMALVSVTSFGAYFELYIPSANATAVSTAVDVLNTPPAWTVGVQESTPSATSTPTNAGAVLSFTATATNSSVDPYWLIICSASSSPIAHNTAPPSCGAGSFQWAISATTTSASSTIAATTTIATAPFNNESNAWYGYVCNADPTGGLCNPIMEQGSGGTASPFVIDHPPVFSAIVNTGNVNPGGTETWTATAYTTDTLRGGDTVQLIVCKTNSFNVASSTCNGGEIATSTLVTSNPATSTPIAIPTQDTSYPAYVYVINDFGLSATSTFQGSASPYLVNEVTPTILPASISLINTTGSGNLVLTTPNGTTTGFKVNFTVNDNNSCVNASSTDEIASVAANVYRSGVGSTTCSLGGAAAFNSNNCYPNAAPSSQMICTQTSTSTCTTSATTINFSCTFALAYNADPTDAGSVYSAQSWLASASSTAWKGAASTLSESSVGNTLNSLVAFGVTKTSISYGGLQPGFSVALSTTTDLQEQGNTGLDEDLYGDYMCPGWSGADSCDLIGATSSIPESNQEFATSSIAYGASGSTALTASTSPSLLGIHVQKTTVTGSPNTKNTFWGILVPSAITFAGNYSGQNTVIAVESSSTNW